METDNATVDTRERWTPEKVEELRKLTVLSRDDTYQLLREAIAADKACVNAYEQAKPFINPNGAPKAPKQVDDLDEWQAYQIAADTYRVRKAHADAIYRAARQWREKIISLWQRFLPSETWFRCDTVGVGLSYTNWGGSSYNIEVAPWAEKMPSLNHRYYGD